MTEVNSKRIAPFLATIIVVLAMAFCLSAVVSAWSRQQIAQPIVGADCSANDKVDSKGNPIKDKNGNYIEDKDDQRCSTTVYRFTDKGHTCYLVKGSNAGGIDCL